MLHAVTQGRALLPRLYLHLRALVFQLLITFCQLFDPLRVLRERFR